MNREFKDMLRLLGDHKVKYLIVGGYAVIWHTQPRFTKDLDNWLRPCNKNAKRVAAALRAFGVPLVEVTEEDFANEGLKFMIGMFPTAIDFLTSVLPLDFAEAWESRDVFETSTGSLNYLSVPNLVRSKSTAGCMQDLADVEEILRLHSNTEPEP